MLHAIWELGHYIRETNKISDIEVLTQTSKLSNTKKMICVVFRKENDSLIFDGVHIEDFDQEKAKKILYRPFRHGRYNAFLTSILTKKKIKGGDDIVKNEIERIKEEYPELVHIIDDDIKKMKDLANTVLTVENLRNKWELWFGQYLDKFVEKYPLIKLSKNEIDKKDREIWHEIIKKYNDLNKNNKQGCIVTIKIKENETEYYPAEIEDFTEIFKKVSIEDMYSKHGVIAKGRGICAFCGKEDEVMSASPFAVFTVKKVGFAYYFDRQNSWKQLPICGNCALDLEVGKEWIMDKNKLNLSFNLYGYKYFVIPRVTFREISDEIVTEIELRKNEDYREGLLNAEEDILELVKEKEDVLSLIFVFYRVKQQFFDIIRYVEDVSPSWIKRIYDTFHEINKRYIFKENSLKILLGSKWIGDFIKGIWNNKPQQNNLAGLVGEFFYHKENNRKTFDKSSLDILGNILESKPIDKNYFVHHLINAIREEHSRENEWYEKLLSIKSLYLFEFLLELGLISWLENIGKSINEVRCMSEKMEKTKYKEKIESFFKDFSNAFDTPLKKALFLEGVLTNFLLAVQYKQRGSTPYRKRLHGLKLNKRKVIQLFPDIIEKLRAYDVAYPEIEELISKYFVEAEEMGWKLSDDEISYYFALGLNLGKIFKGGDEE